MLWGSPFHNVTHRRLGGWVVVCLHDGTRGLCELCTYMMAPEGSVNMIGSAEHIDPFVSFTTIK